MDVQPNVANICVIFEANGIEMEIHYTACLLRFKTASVLGESVKSQS